jgi:hypothetical protein
MSQFNQLDLPTKKVLLERNRNAVTTFTFSKFFKLLGNVPGAINLYPILQPDVYEKILNAKVLRKLIVQLAGPNNIGAAVAEMEPSVHEMLKARHSLKAPIAEFTYSVGKQRKEGLDLQRALGTIKDFLMLREGQETHVEKLIVNGSSGPHDDFAVDLLDSRLEGKDTVETTIERRIPYERRRDALRRIWSKSKDEINKLYGEK